MKTAVTTTVTLLLLSCLSSNVRSQEQAPSSSNLRQRKLAVVDPKSVFIKEVQKFGSHHHHHEQQSSKQEWFDWVNSRLLGPASYGGGQCPVDCGCIETPVDCPRWYSTDDVIKSASVSDPELISTMHHRLEVRREEAKQLCSGHSGQVQDRGGWCISERPDGYDKYTLNGPNGEVIDIPLGHFPASERIVHELTELIQREGIKSISDFGAGVGQFKAGVLANIPSGLEYRAYDGAGNVKEYTQGLLEYFDLTLPLSLPVSDWVMSLEVGEHVPSQYEGVLVRNLHAHNCKGIILSWAILGQGGRGHINNHGSDYLIDVFQDLGYVLDVDLTNKFRNPVDNHEWFEKSLVALRKVNPTC